MSIHDKWHTDLDRLLKNKNFESEKELKLFLDSLIGKALPEISKEDLSNQERAEDLVYEAQELPIHEGRKKAEQALDLDPDCIRAWEYLGDIETSRQRSLATYWQGIRIGKRIYGGEYLKDHKGQFWGFTETRPFIRCMFKVAEITYKIGRKEESLQLLEEIIKLNKNDNMGARHPLTTYLIEFGELEKFRKYDRTFKSEYGAFPFFNRALYNFKKEGESETSNKMLFKAMEENPFVAPILIKPYQKVFSISSYSPGEESEAWYYASYAYHVWWNISGAVKWLKKVYNSVSTTSSSKHR